MRDTFQTLKEMQNGLLEISDYLQKSEIGNSRCYQMDCMEGLRQAPDKFYELCICDPPYGIGADVSAKKQGGQQYGNAAARKKHYHSNGWDSLVMPPEFFKELRRVSKNQIIWGANHFISRIPYDSSAWVVWNKMNGENNFADCELAWTSFKSAVRMFEFRWNGMLQQDMANKETRIHPTQKPIALYKWLLTNYAKPGDKILDTHLGSGSSRIAAHDMGFDFWGYELDADYFAAMEARFQAHISKPVLFAPDQMYNFEQAKLFE